MEEEEYPRGVANAAALWPLSADTRAEGVGEAKLGDTLVGHSSDIPTIIAATTTIHHGDKKKAKRSEEVVETEAVAVVVEFSL